jgi:hypothetical protein
VLYAAGLALAPELYLKWELAWIAPAIVAHAVVVSVVVSLLALAISSLSRSARVAGLGFFGLVAGLEMVRLVLQNGFNRKEAVLLSLQADLQALAVALFGVVDRQLDIWGCSLLCAAVSWAARRPPPPRARGGDRHEQTRPSGSRRSPSPAPRVGMGRSSP